MIDHLRVMHWPGNVRELEHFVQRANVLRLGAPDVRCVDPRVCASPPAEVLPRAVEESWTLARLEREYMETILRNTGGHRGRAAAILGIDRRTLLRKLGAAGGTETRAISIGGPNKRGAVRRPGWGDPSEDV